MYQFYIEAEAVQDGALILTNPEDVNHIGSVLRMKPGERLRCCCPKLEKEYICRIAAIKKDRICTRIEDIEGSSRELPTRITLFQALPKGDKMEWIIQKAVELGAFEIVPMTVHRCVVKLDPARAEKKQKRWNAIAQSAAKQCGRQIIPRVTEVMTFNRALSYSQSLSGLLLPYEEARGMQYTRSCLKAVKGASGLGIMIGPEGGFEKYEVAAAEESGAKTITLGHRILRTETAGMALLSMLIYILEGD